MAKAKKRITPAPKQAPVVLVADEAVPPSAAPKAEVFCRMVKVSVPNSHWPAYQGELVHIVGDKIVKREFLDKPDMFENVYAKVADKIDPRGL